MKRAHEHRKIAALVAADKAHAQRSGKSGGRIVDALDGAAHSVKYGASLAQKNFACRGERHRARRAVKQCAAERFLQQLHLLSDCRLGYIKLLGGLCEAAAFGGRNEVFKLISVHYMPQNKFFLF